jgi:hypothetical protein
MKNYKIVITIELPNGDEHFVIWEPELYGDLLKKGVDIETFLVEFVKNDFKVSPVSYLIELWNNPTIKPIVSKMGSNEVIRELCVGERIFPIVRY